jgi:hypothetical protein
MGTNTAETFENQTCPHCNSSDLFTEPRPPHVALVCRSCSRWIRWIPKNQATELSTKPALKDDPLKNPPTLKLLPREQPPTAGACDHTRQLDLLIESMNRCDRHLEIITRALIQNGVGR